FFGIYPTVTINNCNISNNAADLGAGLYVDFSGTGSGSVVSYAVTNSNFENNVARTNGGAIGLDELTTNMIELSLSDCHFKNNQAKNGGAIFQDNSSLTISRCSFENNQATDFGMEIYNSESELSFNNSSIFNNNLLDGVDDTGGVEQIGLFYLNTASLSANHSTVVGHTEQTDALIFYNAEAGDQLNINNSIFWNLNTTTGLLFSRVKDSEFISGSIINTLHNPFPACEEDPGTAQQDCAPVTFNNILTDDPAFIDLTNGDLRLSVLSPAIDAGDNDDAADTDLAGKDRIYSPLSEMTTDLGAFEFDGSQIGLPIPMTGGNFNADQSYLGADGWTHYFNSTQKLLLLSIRKDGEDIGSLDDGLQVSIGTISNYKDEDEGQNLRTANYLEQEVDWFVMNRFWSVESNRNFNTVKVRFYYDENDFMDLQKSVLNSSEYTGEEFSSSDL
ncbi:MAG: choice-of-anchor Q domain-containing protein, partial [Bacteroidota bacterium]